MELVWLWHGGLVCFWYGVGMVLVCVGMCWYGFGMAWVLCWCSVGMVLVCVGMILVWV